MINRLINESCRPTDEVYEIVEYVFTQIPYGKLERGTVAVKIKDGGGGGHAHCGPNGPRWAGRCRYSIYITIPIEGGKHDCYGLPRVCWHSSKAREATRREGVDYVDALQELYAEWDREYDAGGRRYGRWPIYKVDDWREHLVHITAHELAHVIACDAGRIRGRGSEVQCEQFAERVLNRFRDLTNATVIGMLRFQTDDPKEVTMSTAAPTEAPAPPEQHDGDGDSSKNDLDEALREEITPIKGATVVHTGGRKADSSSKAASSSKKTSSRSRRKSGSTKKASSSSRKRASSTGPKKISALAGAELVLGRASGPLHVNEITKRIMALPYHGLKGKTPEASVGAILAVNAKKRDSRFKRTAPSTYALKGKK